MRLIGLRNIFLAILASLLLSLAGCTTPASQDGDDELAADDEADDVGEEGDDELLDGAEKPAAPAEEAAVPVAPIVEPAPVVQEAPMDDIQPGVVRYVTADKTPAFADKEGKGPQVGIYMAGDPLVVRYLPNCDFAQVKDHVWIRAVDLSSKIVPRKRLDPWIEHQFSAR